MNLFLQIIYKKALGPIKRAQQRYILGNAPPIYTHAHTLLKNMGFPIKLENPNTKTKLKPFHF